MTETLPASPTPSSLPRLRTVAPLAPLHWLRRGAGALRAVPVPCLFYGACFAAMGWLLARLLRGSPTLMVALTCGFLLVGPFLAMGLYEVARRHERGERTSIDQTTFAWGRNAFNIAILGIGLAVVLMLWARTSMLLIAIFFPRRMPDVALLLDALGSAENLPFVATYVGIGALFALIVFAFTAIAIPLMLDRGTDAITAMLASVMAVGRNLPAMLLWAGLIVTLTVLGFATLFAGLIITTPLLGLATWAAYRDLVVDEAAPPT